MEGAFFEFEVSSAVCTGRAHRNAGLPCQDQIAIRRGEGTICTALADGAGSRPRSETGAACVTACVSGALSERFEEFWPLEDPALADRLVQLCLSALARQKLPVYDMACTLLFFAAHQDGRFLAGHLGDGVMISATEAGLRVFSHPENGADTSETFFITGPDAGEHLRLFRGQLPESGTLLLMSDGMAESLYQRSTETPAPVCGRIAQWVHEGDPEIVSQSLERNMETLCAQRSADDLSLIAAAWEAL